MKKAGIRQSNIELLRIVSMLMVLAVHFDGAALGLPLPVGLGSTDAAWWWRTSVETLSIVGVNCFTLISGYFGIRASVRGLLTFVSQCVFYSVAIYSVCALCGVVSFSFAAWGESWLALTHTDLWYVPAYLCLYLLSPFINAGMERLTDRKLLMWTGIFVLVNVYAGWWWGAAFNPNGYTVVQLIMMYCVGAAVRRILSGVPSVVGWSLYLGASAFTAVAAAYMPPLKVYAYNSPLVIVASVGLLLAFAGMELRSGFINYVARSSFAVYLIHKNKLIWVSMVKPMAIAAWGVGSLWIATGSLLAFMAVTFAVAVAADYVRRGVCLPLLGTLFGK